MNLSDSERCLRCIRTVMLTVSLVTVSSLSFASDATRSPAPHVHAGMSIAEVKTLMGGSAHTTTMVGACGILEVHTWNPTAIRTAEHPSPQAFQQRQRQVDAAFLRPLRLISTDGIVTTVLEPATPDD